MGVGVTMFMGGDEEIDIAMPEPSTPAANTAEQELMKFGATLDVDAAGTVISCKISDKKITTQQLGLVLEMKNLTRISFVKCGINDAALTQLKGLEKLMSIDLTGNPGITDAAIQHLSEMKNLAGLIVIETGITEAGVEKLKEALPNCMVTLKPPEGGAGGTPGGGNPGGNPSTGF